MQAGLQLIQVEGFGQVVVGTGLQTHDPVAHRTASREDDDGRGKARLSGLVQHLQAVQARKRQVQHHHVWLAAGPCVQGLPPVAAYLHLHATAFQRALQAGLHGRVVFNQ